LLKIRTWLKSFFYRLKNWMIDSSVEDKDLPFTGDKFLIGVSIAAGGFLGIPVILSIIMLLIDPNVFTTPLYEFYIELFFVVLVIGFMNTKYIKFGKVFSKKYLKMAFHYALYAFIFAQVLIFVYVLIGYNYQAHGAASESYIFNQYRWAYFLIWVFFAPIVEEFAFRYMMFKHLWSKHFWTGLILNSTIFAFAHFSIQFVTASLWPSIILLPLYLFAGFCLSLVYYKTKNLLASMITHGIYNLLVFIITYMYMMN